MGTHDIGLIVNIAMALAWAFAGGVAARRLGLPSMVGYLLAGVALGPFTPGFVGDAGQIRQLAELGVIFLMFGVGLHFSLHDLWEVRKVAIPGALLQTAGSTLLAFFLARSWGWSTEAALLLGLAVSVASTVVLLRGFMDAGLLNTPHARVAVGWLVFEDLATIFILVLLPPLFAATGDPLAAVAAGMLKTAAFVLIMLFIGGRFLPSLLMKISFTKSGELFTITVVAVALGTAVGAAAFFGVSLALGAFLGGVVLGRSSTSHHIAANVGPFRDVFAVLFFVSVGMLLDPHYLLVHATEVAELTALIVIGKTFLTLLLGLILPAPPRTILTVAVGLSQIGEFSFIIGQAGVALGIMTPDQYSLILAGAVFSIMANPFMFRALEPVERVLRRIPVVWSMLEKRVGGPQAPAPKLEGHVVVVGCGRVGEHVVSVLRQVGFPALVVESDPERIREIAAKKVAVLYGDAANSEVLDHACLATAKALVVTVPSEPAAEIVIAATREKFPHLPSIARAGTSDGVRRLSRLGATVVIHPELEGGLEIMRHSLLLLGIPAVQVQAFTDEVRRHQYQTDIVTTAEDRLLAQMTAAVRGMDVAWRTIPPGSPLIGRSISETELRRRTGVTVIAVISGEEITLNPEPVVVLQRGNTLGLLGTGEQIAVAEGLFSVDGDDSGTTRQNR